LASDRQKATIPVVLEGFESWPRRGSLGPQLLITGKLYIKIDEKAILERERVIEVCQLVQSVIQMVNTLAVNMRGGNYFILMLL